MTKNATPREVFKIKLTQGHLDKKYNGILLKSPISLENCYTYHVE